MDLEKILNDKPINTVFWEQQLPARDCGEQVARWLSRFILQENSGLRLLCIPISIPVNQETTDEGKTVSIFKNNSSVSTADVELLPFLLVLSITIRKLSR